MLFPHKMGHPSRLTKNPDNTLTLSNGIVSRRFITEPNFVTIDIRHEIEDKTFWRCLSPEASIQFSDPHVPGTVQTAAIGGLMGQNFCGLFNFHWFNLTTDATAFQYSSYQVVPIEERFFWKPQRYADEVAWPPKGLQLEVSYTPPANCIPVMRNLIVKVVYQIIDYTPIIVKWVEVLNEDTLLTVRLDEVSVENARITEWQKSRFNVQTDYMPRHDFTNNVVWQGLGPDSEYGNEDITTVWYLDPPYELNNNDQELRGDVSQVRLLVNVTYPVGPGYWLEAKQSFASFRVYETLFDSDDVERQAQQGNYLYRLLAPQTSENFLVFYATDCTSIAQVRKLINQTSAAGFEAIVCAPYSGFNPLETNVTVLNEWKKVVDYSHSMGIKIGGYVCLQGLYNQNSSIVLPGAGPYGVACFATDTWGEYAQMISNFVRFTGVDLLETDCPYEGAWCNATDHNHHGLADSQVKQFEVQVAWFQSLKNEFNLIIRAPDPYFQTAGVNQSPIGYTDAQWSVQNSNVEEAQDYTRMYVYDGMFHKTPTMGWIGGAGGDLTPYLPMNNTKALHGLDYFYAQMFGQGLAASCPAAPIVYDTDEGLSTTRKWTTFYRQHRRILTRNFVHVRRPDARSWDCIMHVDADAKADERALGLVFNSNAYPVNVTVPIPLYYANFSIGDTVLLMQSNAEPSQKLYQLDDIYTIYMPLVLPRHSYMHFIVSALAG